MIAHCPSALILRTGDDIGGSNSAQVLLCWWCRWLEMAPASWCKFRTAVAVYWATPRLCTQPFHPTHFINFSSMLFGCCVSPPGSNID